MNLTQLSGDTRYGAAVGRVRVLEGRLLPRHRLVRMAEAPGWAGLLEEVRETDYTEPLAGVQAPEQAAPAVATVLQERTRLVEHLAVDPAPFHVLASQDDFYNLKVLFAARVAGAPPSGFRYGGHVDPQVLQERLREQRRLPPPLDEAWRAAAADYEQHRSLARAEMVVERAFVGHLQTRFDASGVPFLAGFAAHYADLAKLGFVLRWTWWQANGPAGERAAGRDRAFDPALLPAGGTLGTALLTALAGEGAERVAAALQYTPYGALLRDVAAEGGGAEDGAAWAFEKRADDFVSAYCGMARYTPFGVEPLVAFLWFARQEAKNVRMVAVAKRAGLAVDLLLPRLRTGYHE